MAKPVMLSDEAYEALKAAKKEGESFSDVVLRKFSKKGNPAAIKTIFKDLGPDAHLADAIESASKELRKNFKTRKVEL